MSKEVEAARLKLRDRYVGMCADMPLEEIAFRDFLKGLGLLPKLGGLAAVAALKTALLKS